MRLACCRIINRPGPGAHLPYSSRRFHDERKRGPGQIDCRAIFRTELHAQGDKRIPEVQRAIIIGHLRLPPRKRDGAFPGLHLHAPMSRRERDSTSPGTHRTVDSRWDRERSIQNERAAKTRDIDRRHDHPPCTSPKMDSRRWKFESDTWLICAGSPAAFTPVSAGIAPRLVAETLKEVSVALSIQNAR